MIRSNFIAAPLPILTSAGRRFQDDAIEPSENEAISGPALDGASGHASWRLHPWSRSTG